MIKIKSEKIKYTDTSKIEPGYTEKMNHAYNWMAKGYDVFMLLFPLWKKWIKKVIPYIKGRKILEVSFGNGYLMTQYAKNDFDIYGIDYNKKMLEITTKKLLSKSINANLSKANVEKLPFPDNTFDTIINTMAFTGYPDGDKAILEIKRVLKKGGMLLLVDIDYPNDKNFIGYQIVKLWEKLGDIIKDINSLLAKYGFEYQDIPVGGFGSVHLFIATKK
ncbi:MAG: class I SAM-dependent methyltransferase [Calditrichaeota bacterium]|nr:MAG: class I SAM-dependent methyltransferase [Calditrichota bacterium]MBL1207678.1 class I SAM-dependent methyltransferase [Calditrichota bacterium]NOG47512.1 class I SAM-dependent methyltransferase [Calditrichota bacterium]